MSDLQASAARAPFEYVQQPARYAAAADMRVVRIGHGVKTKRTLLSIYAESLPLPAYFGWNFDALEELLGDLSWLNAAIGKSSLSGVVIVHEAIPLRRGSADRHAYLQLLSDLVRRAPAAGGRATRAVFPVSARAKIEACLT